MELTKTQSGETKGSLFNILNQTVTSGGSRLMLERLNSPLLDTSLINNRLNTVENFVIAKSLRTKVREVLKQIPDIERSLTRLQYERGGPRDLLSIKIGCEHASELLKLICKYDFKYNKSEIDYIIRDLKIDFSFIEKLDKSIIETAPMFARDGDFIKHGFSEALDEIKKLKNKSKEHILELQNNYIEITKVQSLKIKYNNVLGYHLEVRKIHESKLLNNQLFHKST